MNLYFRYSLPSDADVDCECTDCRACCIGTDCTMIYPTQGECEGAGEGESAGGVENEGPGESENGGATTVFFTQGGATSRSHMCER